MVEMKKIIKLGDYVVLVYLKEVTVKSGKKTVKVYSKKISSKKVERLSGDFIDFLNRNNCIGI